MSLHDVIEQSTGRRPGQEPQHSVSGTQQQQQQQARSAALGAATGTPTRDAQMQQGPSLSVQTQRGTFTLNALTLAVYGILLADILLLIIAMKV